MGQNAVFVVFSNTSKPIWFYLLEKKDIIILHMFVELQFQAIFRSRDRGSNEGQNWSKMDFSYFSQKLFSRFGSIS